MPRLRLLPHQHSWERFELRDEDGFLYHVGYWCPCGEYGYEIRFAGDGAA